MAKRVNPRHGSMQFWPRVRAKSQTARVRSYSQSKDAKPLGFVGFKAGMTHIQYVDSRKTSLTKGEILSAPVTIVECPPVSVIGARFYTHSLDGLRVVAQVNAEKVPTELKRRLSLPKQSKPVSFDSLPQFSSVRLLVATQPKSTGIGAKIPDVLELAIGGSADEQLAYAKEQLGKTIQVGDVFEQGQLVDSHSVTKGKGYQGPVKRFGINLRQKKSEKTKRGPGSLGGWKAQGHVMYRVAYAGQTGYHLRTEYNKRIELISDDVSQIKISGGIPHYGDVKTTYLLVRGSLGGAKKRLITLTAPIRPNQKLNYGAVSVEHISTESQL